MSSLLDAVSLSLGWLQRDSWWVMSDSEINGDVMPLILDQIRLHLFLNRSHEILYPSGEIH